MQTPYSAIRILDDGELCQEIKEKQNEFLDVYSLYLRTHVAWVRDETRLKAYELHILDPNFSFQI